MPMPASAAAYSVSIWRVLSAGRGGTSVSVSLPRRRIVAAKSGEQLRSEARTVGASAAPVGRPRDGFFS